MESWNLSGRVALVTGGLQDWAEPSPGGSMTMALVL